MPTDLQRTRTYGAEKRHDNINRVIMNWLLIGKNFQIDPGSGGCMIMEGHVYLMEIQVWQGLV